MKLYYLCGVTEQRIRKKYSVFVEGWVCDLEGCLELNLNVLNDNGMKDENENFC